MKSILIALSLFMTASLAAQHSIGLEVGSGILYDSYRIDGGPLESFDYYTDLPGYYGGVNYGYQTSDVLRLGLSMTIADEYEKSDDVLVIDRTYRWRILRATPTVSYMLHPKLTVSIGPDVAYYAQAAFKEDDEWINSGFLGSDFRFGGYTGIDYLLGNSIYLAASYRLNHVNLGEWAFTNDQGEVVISGDLHQYMHNLRLGLAYRFQL